MSLEYLRLISSIAKQSARNDIPRNISIDHSFKTGSGAELRGHPVDSKKITELCRIFIDFSDYLLEKYREPIKLEREDNDKKRKDYASEQIRKNDEYEEKIAADRIKEAELKSHGRKLFSGEYFYQKEIDDIFYRRLRVPGISIYNPFMFKTNVSSALNRCVSNVKRIMDIASIVNGDVYISESDVLTLSSIQNGKELEHWERRLKEEYGNEEL